MPENTTAGYDRSTNSIIDQSELTGSNPQLPGNAAPTVTVGEPVEDTVAVTVEEISLDFACEGLLDGPAPWADAPIRAALADAGYRLERYDQVAVNCPERDQQLTHATVTCVVSAVETEGSA